MRRIDDWYEPQSFTCWHCGYEARAEIISFPQCPICNASKEAMKAGTLYVWKSRNFVTHEAIVERGVIFLFDEVLARSGGESDHWWGAGKEIARDEQRKQSAVASVAS